MVIWDRTLTERTKRAHTENEAIVPIVLSIGDTDGFLEQFRLMAADHKVLAVGYNEATPAMIAAVGPAIVVSPLLSPTFDCIDMACVLSEAGFKGKYRAVSRPIPNPRLIKREIAEISKDLDFDILFSQGFDSSRHV